MIHPTGRLPRRTPAPVWPAPPPRRRGGHL